MKKTKLKKKTTKIIQKFYVYQFFLRFNIIFRLKIMCDYHDIRCDCHDIRCVVMTLGVTVMTYAQNII